MKKKILKWLAYGVIGVIVLAIIAVTTDDTNASSSQKSAEEITPTDAVSSKDAGDAEKITSSEGPKTIPGIAAVDVYGSFEQKGFSVDKKFTGSGCTFTCSQIDGDKVYEVTVYGKKPESIDKVKATVMFEKADAVSKQFIGYAASIPYTDGNPAAATEWATDHFQDGGDTTIGNVRFVLTAASPTARVLTLYAH